MAETAPKRAKQLNVLDLFEQLKAASSASELDDTLALIASALEGEEGLKKLESNEMVPYITNGLQAQVPAVRQMAMTHLQRLAANASTSPATFTFLTNNDFVNKALQMISDEVIAVNEAALLFLVNLCKSSQGLAAVLSAANLSYLQTLSKTTDIVAFRVLDLYCRIAGLGSEQFQVCLKNNLLDTVIDQMNSDDILLKLNTYQLLQNLGASLDGLKYLRQKGVLRSLWETVCKPKPEDFLGLPTVMQTVAVLARAGEPGSNLHFEQVLGAAADGDQPLNIFNGLREQLEHENDEVVLATIWAVASVAASPLGLKSLMDKANSGLVSEWLEFSSSSNGDLRATLLSAIGSVIDRRASDDPIDTPLLKELYGKLFQHFPGAVSMERLMRQLDEPVVELRFAVYALLKALCKHEWGIKEVVLFPGVREYLADRSTEHTKRGSEWKFAMIQQIISHPKSKEIIGVNLWHEMLLYIKQGPFFVKRETRVILEDRAE